MQSPLLICALLLACLLLSTAAMARALQLGDVLNAAQWPLALQRNNNNEDPQKQIWALCDNPAQHPLQPDEVVIEPQVPRSGQPLHVRVRAHTSRAITGGRMQLQIKLGLIQFKQEFPLCQVLGDYTSARCPIAAGPLEVDVRTEIPQVPGSVPLKGTVRLFAEDGQLLTCVELAFKLERG